MNGSAKIAVAGLIVALAAAGGGYWAGKRGTDAGQGTTLAAVAEKGARKVLYYRNPMGLADTSPVPKKDPMGMDYVPVYEGGEGAEPVPAGQIRIDPGKVQKLGVRTESVGARAIDRAVRAAGRIEPDERRIYTVTAKFEGYVERLHVNATGQAVGKGQPLFDVYSPELVSAQREYAIAAQGVQALQRAGSDAQGGMRQLADASLLRLKNWDISEDQIKALAKAGAAKRILTFRSPVSGIVTEKKAVQGMRFMPGDALYQVADLSTVWLLADVFEQDIGLLKRGARAMVAIDAYPGQQFEGTVAYIYPTVNPETRTAQVRVELANRAQLLKPGMFAQVELAAGGAPAKVAVPVSAVIDSGTRRLLFVQIQEGRFEPREVRLGARGNNYVEVLDGVTAGEQVVVAANFLIDAESNLKSVVGSFRHSGHGGAKPAEQGGGPAAPPASGHAGHGATAVEQKPVPLAQAATAGHRGEGRVQNIDPAGETITLDHGPVPSLKWPAMAMEFKVTNGSVLHGIKPGAQVAFELVERQPGDFVITSINPVSKGAADADPHAGH